MPTDNKSLHAKRMAMIKFVGKQELVQLEIFQALFDVKYERAFNVFPEPYY